jgi:hypothetical protein
MQDFNFKRDTPAKFSPWKISLPTRSRSRRQGGDESDDAFVFFKKEKKKYFSFFSLNFQKKDPVSRANVNNH